MSVPLAHLRRMLNADEPDYASLARIGSRLLPQLQQLVGDSSAYVAANAASLAGMIDDPQAISVLHRASQSASAHVRGAVAGALRRGRRTDAAATIARLLGDADKGVRKFALKAAAAQPDPALAVQVQRIAQSDPHTANRARALAVARSASGRA